MNYNILNLIILILLFILLFILIYKNILEHLFLKKKLCIIITTHINSNEKYNIYLPRVKKWIQTGYDIYLVDSNNKGLNIKYPNYKEYLFNQQNQKYYHSNVNSSILEINSLIKIINHFHLTTKYDYIYKVTGKYFINEYQHLYINEKDTYDLILQSRCKMNFNNSEIVGFHSTKIISYLNYIINLKDTLFEKGLGNLKNNNKIKIKQLKPLTVVKLPNYVKRAYGDILTIL